MDTKINIYISSIVLKMQNFLTTLRVISVPSVLPAWKNLHWKSTIYENDVENTPPWWLGICLRWRHEFRP